MEVEQLSRLRLLPIAVEAVLTLCGINQSLGPLTWCHGSAESDRFVRLQTQAYKPQSGRASLLNGLPWGKLAHTGDSCGLDQIRGGKSFPVG